MYDSEMNWVGGFKWLVTLVLFFGILMTGAGFALKHILQSSHAGRPPNASVMATPSIGPSYNYAAVTPALLSTGYAVGRTDTFANNGRYSGVMWQSQTANAPVVVLYADGSQKGLVAQVRAADGSFWCAAPPQYRDNPSVAVVMFTDMAARFQRHFAVGETLRLKGVLEDKSVEVVCGRANS